MRTLGYVTAITLAAAGTALGIQAVRSLPELRRYLAIRKMLGPSAAPGHRQRNRRRRARLRCPPMA
jgi:hypothetical protein